MHFCLPGREMTGNLFDQSMRIFLCLLIVAILGGIAAGVVSTFIDVYHTLISALVHGDIHQGLKSILIDIRSLWDPKTAKFEPPKRAMEPDKRRSRKKQLSFSNFRKSKIVS